MEANTLDSPISGDQLIMDGMSAEYLFETARWAKFLSIVGFVMCGIIVLIGFFATSIFSTLGALQNEIPMAGFGYLFMALYIGLGVLYFFPCFYLFNFATQMKKALVLRDQTMLNQSLRNIKSCFKFMGIMMIIVLGFYGIVLLFGGIAAAFM
jgi:hypothetical protein